MLYAELYTSQLHLSRFPDPRFYTEPCRSNAGVPGGRICSSVLDISFHRIKALAAIASPSSAERLRTNPRDVISGWGGGKGEEGRQMDRGERNGVEGRGGWFKGWRDKSWVKGLQACGGWSGWDRGGRWWRGLLCLKQEFGPLHGRVNRMGMALSSTSRTRVWRTAEFPPAQHPCLSPSPSPHLASPPLTPMSLFTHPLVCLERQHTTAPPPPRAPASPFLHPDNPATPHPIPHHLP